MANRTAVLRLLLLLYWHGIRWTGGQIAEQSGRVSETDHHNKGDPAKRDSPAESITAKSSRSSCPPLSRFVKCHNVAVPDLTGLSYDPATYRGAALPVTMRAFGREFRLRMHTDAVKPDMAWSSVISPSAVVRVMGKNGTSREYTTHELNIGWYSGYVELEVAPSSVRATVVNASGQQMFRAVVQTTSDVYYIEPAVDYPEVQRAFVTYACALISFKVYIVAFVGSIVLSVCLSICLCS